MIEQEKRIGLKQVYFGGKSYIQKIKVAMKTPGKVKIIAVVASIVLLLAVVTSAYFISTNSSLKSGLNSEKLRNESLLSEKLALEKEIMKFKNEIDLLNGKNTQTDKLLTDAHMKLSENGKAIARLNTENATVKSLKKQIAEIKAMKEDLMHQVSELNSKNLALAAENQQLQKSLASMQLERNDLLKQMDLAHAESIQKADNYQVDTYRNIKREIQTVKAKRMKMMSVFIDVPKELTTGVSFTITTPDGKVINEKDKSISWKVLNNEATLTASLNPSDDHLVVTQQIKLTFAPTSKMKPGIYKIGILNNSKNIGNCRIRLQ